MTAKTQHFGVFGGGRIRNYGSSEDSQFVLNEREAAFEVF